MIEPRSPLIRRLLAGAVALACGVGCGSNKLETGYAFTPLGATATERRAYYAGPFSPEARAAMLNAEGDEIGGSGGRRNRQ